MARPSRHDLKMGSRGAGHVARDEGCSGMVRQLWLRVGSPPRLLGVGEACTGCGAVSVSRSVLAAIESSPLEAVGLAAAESAAQRKRYAAWQATQPLRAVEAVDEEAWEDVDEW